MQFHLGEEKKRITGLKWIFWIKVKILRKFVAFLKLKSEFWNQSQNFKRHQNFEIASRLLKKCQNCVKTSAFFSHWSRNFETKDWILGDVILLSWKSDYEINIRLPPNILFYKRSKVKWIPTSILRLLSENLTKNSQNSGRCQNSMTEVRILVIKLDF